MNSRGFNPGMSLTVSAMLTSSFLATVPRGPVAAGAGPQAMPAALEQALSGLRVAGFGGLTDLPVPQPPQSLASTGRATDKPSGPALTPEELSKVDGLLSKVGADLTLAPFIAQALKLPNPEVRQLKGQDDDVHAHYFNRSKKDANVILLMYKSQGVVHGFRTDPSFTYSVGYVSQDAETVRPLSREEGEKGMADEIRWWSKALKE